MKTQTYIQVTSPCNEDWNKMADSEKGRFCDACAIQVIDFTLLTDHQVLSYLASAKGKVCGRFSTEQLDRGLNDTSVKKKKVWQWVLTGFTSLFFASKSFAQGKLEKQLSQASSLTNNKHEGLKDIGPSSITIKGKIMDDATDLLSKASIVEPGTLNNVFTNRNGDFVMQVDVRTTSVLVQANGYDSRVVPVSMLNNTDTIVQLKKSDTTRNTGPDVFDKNVLNPNIIMGGITNYTEVEKPAPITTFVKKVFNNAFFKILPNPTANGSLGLSIKQAGTYAVQIFDNSSKLVHVAEVTINDKGQVAHISLPTCVSMGTYYIRLIDTKTKKEYVDKMIVQ